ncbi:Arc family DNA-binding protein [Variovorax sp.]|jgi:hypothetical protein|uniref:Arc family DNA-binding protein n=1 Tax=Variovorax sp. TaxID=1871043 RepID=UPI004037A9A0
MSERRPVRTGDRHDLKLPDGMRERFKRSATLSGRTLNAELIHRLQATLDGTYGLPLPSEILEMLKAAARETGRSLEDEGYVRLLDSLNGWSEVQTLRRDLDEAHAALARLNALNRENRR